MRGIETKEQLARALAEESGFYIKNMREVLDALDRIILKNLKQSRIDNPSIIYIAKGVYIEGRRVKAREVYNPQDRSICTTSEKIIPKATFSRAFREKLWSDPTGYEKKRLNKKYNMAKKQKKQQEEDINTNEKID